MQPTTKLTAFISSFEKRQQKLLLLTGLAKLSLLLVVVCLLSAWWVSSSGFADSPIWLGRIAIVVALAAGLYFFVIKPRQQSAKQLAAHLEQRHPDFGGRMTTWLDNTTDKNPVTALLAADTISVAEQRPVTDMIPSHELNKSRGIAIAGMLVLVLSLWIAPGMMNHSLRHLLAGWVTKDGLLPPQTLIVSPGDATIRLGSNLNVIASASGFNPDVMSIHVKMPGESWQNLAMTPAAKTDELNEHDFSFFAVRESVEYYVSAGNVRSPNYEIDVIELPNITSLTLTYDYPDWTGLEDLTQPGGDVEALPGTNISLEVTTDSPLPSGSLVLNENDQPLELDGTTGTSEFEVNEYGEYYLAANMGGEQVRLSDTFFIRTSDNKKPTIEFSLPGSDYRASNIEEVLAELTVKDDYGVDNVRIHYSVNGGEWQETPLSQDGDSKIRDASIEHLFPLEDLGNNDENQSLLLQAGDLISYYASASDLDQTTQTDIFFIEIQPFDRRFSQSQQSGGGMGGGQGENEQEISQKQREIIISTWNLSRENNEAQAQATNDEQFQRRISDNAKLLSGLQKSLAEQTSSLVETARARMLDSDERIETFIDHMESAIEAMTPASEQLALLELEQAMQPEQTALQYLLRADAVYNDIQVSTQQGAQGGGGGGGQAARELTEMFELEIDLEKNQYETGSRASLEDLAQAAEETIDELGDLAQRQEQLARNTQGQDQLTEAQRWQQEMLRRETEALKEKIEQQQLQRDQNQARQQGQGTQSDAQAGSETSASSSQEQNDEIGRRLDSAIEAMERASEAMDSGDQQQIQQASGEAQRQLSGAGEQIARDQEQSLQQSFDDMAKTASELALDQQRLEQQLLDGVQKALASEPDENDFLENPFSWEEELAMADQKRDMNARLQRLQGEIMESASNLKSDSPGVARKLEQASNDVKEAEISERLDNAVSYMSQGASLYIANSESMVTRELDSLSDAISEAREQFMTGDAGDSNLDEMLAELSTARNSMQDLLESNQPAENGAEGEQGDAQGQSEATGSSSSGASTDANGGEAGGNNQAGGRWDGWGRGLNPIGDDESQLLDQQVDQAALNAGRLLPELEERGVSAENLEEITSLIQQLQNASLKSDASVVDYNDALATIQLLEMNIEQGLAGDETLVRSENPDIVPEDYKEAVAEYYRRLTSAGRVPEGSE